MNGGVNALGQGNRANLTIGRAVQLVVRNVGGGRPGGVDRATHGNPGKLVVLLRRAARLAVRTRWPRAAARRRASTPSRCSPARGRAASSTSCRATPESLARSLAACLRTVHHPKLVLGFDAILVLGPEHAQGVRRGRLGPPARARRARRLPAAAGRRARRAAPAASPRACPSSSPTPRCRSSARAASCSPTRVAAPGCSRPSSGAGPTAPSAAARHQGGWMT